MVYCITYNLYNAPAPVAGRRGRQQKIELFGNDDKGKAAFESRYAELTAQFAKSSVWHLLESHTLPDCCLGNSTPLPTIGPLYLLFLYQMDESYEKHYLCGIFENIDQVNDYKELHAIDDYEAEFKEYLICIYDIVSHR